MHSLYAGMKKTTGAWDCLGEVQGQVGENKGLMDGGERKFSRCVAAVGVNYNFSRRTMGYAALSHSWVGKAWRDNGAKTLERPIGMVGVATVF